MSPTEFDDACREIERRHPSCWRSSGYRGPVHNIAVGGDARSKHSMIPCMAADYNAGTEHARQAIADTCRELGLWYTAKEHGTGPHVHIQGLPPGPIDALWLELYSGDTLL